MHERARASSPPVAHCNRGGVSFALKGYSIMATVDDQAPNARAARGLLGSLRDVLFENTSQRSAEISEPRAPVPGSSGADADADAARTVLRTTIEARLGPGIVEFSLQDQALTEVLPDPAIRRRAALRVLALKGTSRADLCLELEQALATLSQQGEAFARKLNDRREALLTSQRGCADQCARDTSAAEEVIVRLQGELDAEHRVIVEAQAHRDQELAACEATLAELSTRERGFQRAFHDLEDEYLGLKNQLSQEPL